MKTKKEEAIKKIQESDVDEWVIRTSKEEEDFKFNLIENEVEAKIGSRIKETYDNIDKDITKVLGTIKPKEIKTFDYIPQILSELKSKADKVEELETQIASKSKPSEELERLKGELKSVRELYNTEKGQWETERGDLLSKHNQTLVRGQIESALAGFKLKKDVPESVLNAFKEVELNRLVGMAQLTENGVIFKDGEKTILNPTTAAPKSPQEILAERFKDVIDVSVPKAGTGTKATFKRDGGKITGVEMILPDSVQSRDDLGKYLMEQGLARGSAEYTAAYAEHSKDLPPPSV
jgi:hypothetical protein